MTAVDATTHFAALKAAFNALCDLAPAARGDALQAWRERDAAFADALAALLSNLDDTDLQPPPDDVTQLRFGPFRVLRRLGQGGMGEVFLAERSDAGFEQRVALKRVRLSRLPDDLTRRFLRERQLLARLQHPGIARLVDGGVGADGHPWLAMEYVEGLSLLRHVREHRLGLAARIDLLRCICAAVAYAHRNLVIHRDLKPANVLVTPEGEPKLLDFGIAKLLDDGDGHADATRADQRALTVRYAAPEQLTGERTTTATDIYALGVLLFELVADVPAYARAAAGEVDWHQAILRDAPRTLADALRPQRAAFDRATWRHVTGDLDRIVRRALEKTAADRYGSVASLDADLEDWRARRPLRSGIGGTRAQTTYLLTRYRWPLALAGGVLLAFGIGAVLALQQAQRANAQAAAAHARLETVLRVLGSANPRKFAASDPSAGDFLVGTADLFRAQLGAGDPELARRALTEIGHALLNLDRAADAEAVLQDALAATDQDPALPNDVRLDILGLLMNAQDTPQARPRAAAGAARIEKLAARPDVSDRSAVDALARAGGTLAKAGDFVGAQRLFTQALARVQRVRSVDRGITENLLRQYGWAALRAQHLDVAIDALRGALAQVAAAPADFSPLRRAEGDALLAQALIAHAGVAERADAHALLARATPVFEAEYPDGHPERAAFQLHAAELALVDGDATTALPQLEHIAAVLHASAAGEASDRATVATLTVRALANTGQCDAALRALDDAMRRSAELAPMLPREQVRLRDAALAFAARCVANPGS